jgi:hypothetical protein
MTVREKVLIAAALFIAWGALVFLGKAPAPDFVVALRDALIGLGIFQAAASSGGRS